MFLMLLSQNQLRSESQGLLDRIPFQSSLVPELLVPVWMFLLLQPQNLRQFQNSVLAGSSSKLLSEMNMPSLPKKLQPRLPRCFSQSWCPWLVNLSGPRESCWRHSGPRGPLVLDFIIIWFYNYNFIWLQKAALLPLEPVTLQAEFANGGTSQNWFLIDF